MKIVMSQIQKDKCLKRTRANSRLNFIRVLGRVCKPHANQIMEEASFKKATKVQANLS